MGGQLGSQCRAPRCPKIIKDGQRYCAEHSNETWNGAANRETLTFYRTAQWQRIRKVKLGQNPICEVCLRRLATQVHHLKKAREFPELRFVMSNLQSICLWCHARETQKETLEVRKQNGKKRD